MRGWSQRQRDERQAERVVPAHAGLPPTGRFAEELLWRGPRMGGGPVGGAKSVWLASWSPRVRGWSPGS